MRTKRTAFVALAYETHPALRKEPEKVPQNALLDHAFNRWADQVRRERNVFWRKQLAHMFFNVFGRTPVEPRSLKSTSS